jgi:hypothetical protein
LPSLNQSGLQRSQFIDSHDISPCLLILGRAPPVWEKDTCVYRKPYPS